MFLFVTPVIVILCSSTFCKYILPTENDDDFRSIHRISFSKIVLEIFNFKDIDIYKIGIESYLS